jgi:type IV pilus assembly protein PilA
MSKKAFTLIELLVVVGIVSLLAGVMVIAINPIEMIKQGRDSKRLQEIQSIRQMVNIALADSQITLNGTSSVRASGNSVDDGTLISDDGSAGWVKVSTVSGAEGLRKYISELPADPQGFSAPGSGYEWESDGEYFVIRTSFETEKYQTTYAATDGGADNTKFEIGTKANYSW